MKKIYFLLAFFMLVSVNVNLVLAADNYKLHARGDADSDANLLVTAGTYFDTQTAQDAIYSNEVASPWKFGNYEFATEKFLIYDPTNASYGGGQWGPLSGLCPITSKGESFQNDAFFSPVIFFVAPAAAIYKVSTNFQYQSNQGKETNGYSLFQFKAKNGTAVQNMNFGKSYTDHTVLASDFYVNLHVGDTIAFNQNCTLWGDPFCVWTKLQIMGNSDGIPFTSAEANQSGFYFDNYVVVTDFSFLNTKITDSEAMIVSTMQGTVQGTYPAAAISTFQSAIDAAKSIVTAQPAATQLAVNAQLATLTTAYTLFSTTFVITVSADAANNYKLHGYGDADSDAMLLVKSGAYPNAETAQKAIYHNDIASPWKFGTYEFATDKFLIYSDSTATWNENKQWGSLKGDCPLVFDGHSFVFAADFSPVIFFVAPKAAIYLVSTNFQYQSTHGEATEGTDFFQFKSTDGKPAVKLDFGGIYTQDSPTILTDFFVNLHAGDTIAFNQTATLWGDPFCGWVNLQVMGNENGAAYTSEMVSGLDMYYNYYPVVSALNQTVVNNMKIMNVENGIRIITDKVAPVSVYNLTGMLVKNCIVNADEIISLTKGAYIVKLGNTIQKIIVR